jgi:hypothetical protein
VNEPVEKTTTEKLQKPLEDLFTELNHYGNEDEVVTAITNFVTGQHRTLQQNFFRTIDAVINNCANAPHDLRNEASVTWCAKVKGMDGDTLYYFPIV